MCVVIGNMQCGNKNEIVGIVFINYNFKLEENDNKLFKCTYIIGIYKLSFALVDLLTNRFYIVTYYVDMRNCLCVNTAW